MTVPEIRIRHVNDRPVDREGSYVLYWMIAARRTRWNFALQHAVTMAEKLGKPLVILEALRCDYPYASDRLHHFILDGMAANAETLKNCPVTYYPYIEAKECEDRGLLVALSVQACLVVTDDYPAFIMPRIVESAGRHLPMRLDAVDSNGLLPLRAADHAYPTAYAFRRFLQKTLPEHLLQLPEEDPLARADLPDPDGLPGSIRERWRDATPLLAKGGDFELDRLPIDHSVPPAPAEGGQQAAANRLADFIEERLDRYADDHNHPNLDATSGLSPYLHFGHISAHEVFAKIADHEDWSLQKTGPETAGKRTGWWGMSAGAEAFLDQLVTWRELGYNMCTFEAGYRDYASLPEWARKTLGEHAGDPRPTCYTLEELRGASTHDSIWNAAQNQLLQEGMIHNYLRMLWGKKILEWSPSPQAALDVMIELNDRYALDGRDPNSYSGIFWCLGRYDRAWGPTRPIFGSVRYMSSENTRRKLKLKLYLEKYS